jgi:hypothetical protein
MDTTGNVKFRKMELFNDEMIFVLCTILDSHSGGYGEFYFLEYNAV